MKLILLLALAGTLHGSPAFEEFMGINGHTVQFRPDLYAPIARHVRDYHPAEWDLGKESDYAPQFPFARNRVNWETVYGAWKERGWRIDVSLMFETLAPAEWKDLARDSRAYAERFARAFGPSSANPLVETVEIGNEPGKFSDEQYRTVFENMARGFRAADPKLKIATCAVTTGPSHDYAKSVNCIAGLEQFYDILNVHTYPELEPWPTWRRSHPEDPRLKSFVADVTNLCRWRDGHAAGKPVWITEFGYDSSTKAPNPATEFKQWVGVTDEQQAQWIVRSWLLFASLPVERAYLFFFNDSDEPQVHGSSGLTRNFQPKPSFHAAAHLQRTLGPYRFGQNIGAGPARIAEFRHKSDKSKSIWVVWLPSGAGATAQVELPKAPGKIVKVERMPLSADQGADVEIQKRPILATESPAYIFIEKSGEPLKSAAD